MKLSEITSIEEDTVPLLEMATLRKDDTGFDGIVFISPEMGKHDVRVKWHAQVPKSRMDPCLIITVVQEAGGKQKVENHHLPKAVAAEAQKNVEAWIEKNRDKIVKFWDEVFDWHRDEINPFLNTLEKI